MPLDESQMAHQLLKDLVVALLWLLHELILDHLDVSLCIPHVLLHIHVSFTLTSNRSSVDKKLATDFLLVV